MTGHRGLFGGEVDAAIEAAYGSAMSGVFMQLDQILSGGLRGRVSTRDLPPVDHRMLGRPPLFPEEITLTVSNTVSPKHGLEPTGEELVENIRQAMASAWSPPPLTSADLYADWQYRCAQHAKQRY